MTISYHVCPKCLGHWLTGFDANYLNEVDTVEKFARPFPSDIILHCPTCQKNLEKVHGDAIPPEVTVFHCPDSHGYFFPIGQLTKFKKAQETKISYHKLWHIPLPPLQSVLLASIIIFLGISGVTVYMKIGQTQTTQSQAKDVIAFQQVIVSSGDNTLLFLVRTNEITTITLHGDTLNTSQELETTDGLSHTLRLSLTTRGTLQYYYSWTKQGKDFQSKNYSVQMR